MAPGQEVQKGEETVLGRQLSTGLARFLHLHMPTPVTGLKGVVFLRASQPRET